MFIDDYTYIVRAQPGDYFVYEICLGTARGGNCRCVTHDRYTEIGRYNLGDSVRLFGAALVREAIDEAIRGEAFRAACAKNQEG